MKAESKVGLLFLFTVALVAGFSYFLGAFNFFSNAHELFVMYNYAGGIEVGSPVRVMGIKVGKVKAIDFIPDMKTKAGEEVKLRLTITIEKKAWSSVRRDSLFFINLAGVIGEKFLEITPGSLAQTEFTPGEFIRGEDPPRIDQLISQGYGLAGKLLDIVDKNEGTVENLIKQLDKMLGNFNRAMSLLDKTSKNERISHFVDNAIKISDDLVFFTGTLRSPKAQDTFELVHKLIWRLDGMDGHAIRKFLQQEGIKARLFN